MDDLENNVKRIVSEEVNRSQNEFLSKLDSLFATKFQVYDQQQKERSDAQFNRIHNDLLSTDSYKFQRKSCEDQFKFNQKVSVALKEAEAVIEPKDPSAARAKQKISEGIGLLNYRQKLVKMADSSECWWKLVQEYTANPLADDSEDDRKIFRAQNRAERKIKADRVKRRSRAEPYVKPASSSGSRDRQTVSRKPGVCYNCYKPGHWQNECSEKKRPKLSKFFDKCCNLAWDLSYKSNFELEGGSRLLNSAHKEVNETMVNCVNGSVRYDESNDQTSGHLNLQVNVLTPVGKLNKAIHKWKETGTSEYILKVIEQGYGIPFKTLPDSCVLRNNKSSLDNSVFVNGEISKLLDKKCISEVHEIPYVVNPITVAYNRSAKPRLVLDCRHINECIHQFKFKFEDGSVAKQLFNKGNYLFRFDVKSAYHHIEILPDHRKYLGFSWQFEGTTRYYVFNVLPFGIASAGHIFTKLTKEVVKYWRSQGLRIIMYLDDGLGGDSNFDCAHRVSTFVRESLTEFGFLIAEEKCIWLPVQNITWIRLFWEMQFGKLSITEERVERLLSVIDKTLKSVGKGKLLYNARFVAGIVGQIISMMSVMGNVCRLRTRELYNCLIMRASWNSLVVLNSVAIEELYFWFENLRKFNRKGLNLHESDFCDFVAYTDASDVGFGGYVVPADTESVCDSDCIMKMTDCGLEVPYNSLITVTSNWSVSESVKSSTWRELEAVSRVVKSSVTMLKNHTVQLNTDNKNVTSIIKNGSRKSNLQEIACDLNELCTENNISIKTQWVPREQNTIADNLSRYSDSDDWGIHFEVFDMLDELWGKHSIDRFATDYNSKCFRFNSKCWCKGTEAIDAFTQNWQGENNWLAPPPNLIAKVIRKVCNDSADSTLVVPFWKSAPFWALLHNSNCTFVESKMRLTNKNLIVRGRGNNGIFGVNPLNFAMIAFKIRF